MKRLDPKERKLPPGEILTRIYIGPNGDCIVTDFWEEIQRLLSADFQAFNFETIQKGE